MAFFAAGCLVGIWIACAIMSAAIREDAWMFCGLLMVSFLSGMAVCFLIFYPEGGRDVDY